ncbi:MAG: PDZ domain-containing protein [Candidatus Omnitrophica bacterium]|nr:PDZ domain-containing protein [Candidatus Omnitrophota bacterium]
MTERLIRGGWRSCLLTGALCAALSGPVTADTVVLNSGQSIKGLVVENHEDRIVISTADGEKVVLKSDYQQIDYDEPAYSLMEFARDFDHRKKYIEALSYYEKALELNPELDEARKAAMAIRNRLWASHTEGPVAELSKQQDIRDAWSADQSLEEIVRQKQKDLNALLWDRMGLKLSDGAGDWVSVEAVRLGSEVFKRGVRQGDLLQAVDGQSLRHLKIDAVRQKILEPRYSSMTLDVLRSYRLGDAGVKSRRLGNLGLRLKQEYQGPMISDVKPLSPADRAGIREGDLVIEVADKPTRYLKIKQVKRLIERGGSGGSAIVVLKRTLQMSRK